MYQFHGLNIEVSVTLESGHFDLQRFFGSKTQEVAPSTVDAVQLKLSQDEYGHLLLAWYKEGQKKPTLYTLDFTSELRSLRSFPAPKQGAFNQALGSKTRCVLDATAGWGGDAMLMSTQGYDVTMMERNPLMALLLEQGVSHLRKLVEQSGSLLKPPKVIYGDGIEMMQSHAKTVDCVYLDPMFPPKRKKTAAANKQMQLLQWMLGQDHDAAQLVEQALNHGAKRVAVKRPSYAEPLFRKPDDQFSSKLVHYDVYLPH